MSRRYREVVPVQLFELLLPEKLKSLIISKSMMLLLPLSIPVRSSLRLIISSSMSRFSDRLIRRTMRKVITGISEFINSSQLSKQTKM